jgi:hypothetical protein
MSDLAAPALRVSAAVAEKAESCEPAVADRVQQSVATVVPKAPGVGPAANKTYTYSLASKYSPVTTTAGLTSLLSVVALRGESGADFESYAAVLRGASDKNFLQVCLPCIYDERDFVTFGEVKKYCLIKGSSCFIYMQDTDMQPLYAIELEDVYPVVENPNLMDPWSVTVSPMPNTNKPRKEMITVLLKYRSNHQQAYQFTFDTLQDASLAKRFVEAVRTVSNMKRGTGGGPVTASIMRADGVAKQAAQQQPRI